MSIKATDEDVRYAYRLLLGREPDAAGLATYGKYLIEQAPSVTDLAGMFLDSEEFRRRQPMRLATASSGARLAGRLKSSVCVQRDLESLEFREWTLALRARVGSLHRKLWEWCYICQVLSERGMLADGRRGLGFAVGQEPLASLFCSRGCLVLATDLDAGNAAEAGWVETGQHATRLEDLNARAICAPDVFAQRAAFRVVDMNAVPDDLIGFDFAWSSCAIEHLGSLDAGVAFVRRVMRCLRPGGIAVHTTEFNVSSDDQTIESGHDVIFRRRDLEQMAHVLGRDGHIVEPFDFDTGNGPADTIISTHPHISEPVLKFWFGGFVSTSIGIIVTRSE
jgi:SAM-dependent methyltransferase